MKKLNGLLLAGVALCLAASPAWAQQRAQVQAAPQLQQTQAAQQPAPVPASQDAVTANAVLSATETWRPIATGLRAGGRLQITASGQWRVIQQFRSANTAAVGQLSQPAGPDGYVDLQSDIVILPSAPVAALIGRIGENGTPFLIGSQYNEVIASDGDLFVTINDAPDQLQDNAGRLSIQVSVTAPPPPPPLPEEQIVEPPKETPIQRPTIPPGLIQIGLIGAAILVGLLLIGSLFGRRAQRSDANDRRNPAVPQVTTRVVTDGAAGQSLTLTMRRR